MRLTESANACACSLQTRSRASGMADSVLHPRLRFGPRPRCGCRHLIACVDHVSTPGDRHRRSYAVFMPVSLATIHSPRTGTSICSFDAHRLPTCRWVNRHASRTTCGIPAHRIRFSRYGCRRPSSAHPGPSTSDAATAPSDCRCKEVGSRTATWTSCFADIKKSNCAPWSRLQPTASDLASPRRRRFNRSAPPMKPTPPIIKNQVAGSGAGVMVIT